MKKLIFSIWFVFLLGTGMSQTPWYTYSQAGSLATADILLLYQSGVTKNFTIGTLANMLNDTADILRAEFPPLWRSDIADTATQLRVEIAGAATADTAWTYLGNYVFLKHINDSVGIGTTTPTSKFEVNGEIKGLRLNLDNGSSNDIIIGKGTGASLSGSQYNLFAGYYVAPSATSVLYSVGLGYHALYSLTIGDWNTAISYLAGYKLTTGSGNYLGGPSVGYSLITGVQNLYLGYLNSYLCGSSSSYGVRLGAYAGYTATGSYNLFAGYKTAYSNTASYGVGLGGESIYNLTENGGVGIGYQSAKVATSASRLTTGGFQSFLALTTGDDNSGWGNLFGSLITTGSKVSGLGSKTLAYTAVDIEGVSALGWTAGDSSSADYAIYIGTNSGGNNTTDSTLFIDITDTSSPLIHGFFGTDSLVINTSLTTGRLLVANNLGYGSASYPSLAFGDGNTGFYEEADNQLVSASGGNAIKVLYSTGLEESDDYPSAGLTLRWNTEPSTTVPNITPAGADANTGIGTSGTEDQFSLIAGGLEVARITESGSDASFIVDPGSTGTVSVPSLAFGDGNTGFYESADNEFSMAIAGAKAFEFSATDINPDNDGSFQLSRADATSTNPVFTFLGDNNTGLGRAGTDILSLIAGGVEGIRITETGSVVTTLVYDTLRADDYAGGANAWVNESDRRLKKNIRPITNGLNIVKGLQGVKFEWKDNPEAGTKIGFIAQDVENVLPEVVAPGKTYAMETSQITAVLVEAMKTQQAQLEYQQRQIDELREEINRLKSKK